LAAYSDTRSGDKDIVVSRICIEPFNGTLPSAPENLKVEQGNRIAILSWEPPIETSDLPIIAYKVYWGPSEDNLTLRTALGASQRLFEDHMVETGKTYHYSVSALSFVGEGNMSNVVNVSVVGPSRPPDVFEAFPGDGNVTLTWRPPSDTGWLPVLGYIIKRGSSKLDQERIAEIGNVTTWVDEDVENGVEYYYSVLAVNSFGEGEPTTDVVSAVPFGLPTEPRYLTAISGDSQISLEWRPPQNDGGRSILGYRIYRGLEEGTLEQLITVAYHLTSFVDNNLTNGATYHYAIQAFNELGDGPLCDIVNGTPAGLSGAPVGLVAEASDGQVLLSWGPPELDGGIPILLYHVLRGTQVNGQTFYYAVSALNEVGDGPRTDVLKARPLALPDVPGGIKAEAGNGQVTFSWIRPMYDGGTEITNYLIHRGTSEDSLELLIRVNNRTFKYDDVEVEAGTEYFYAVVSLTAAGESPKSIVASAVPYALPICHPSRNQPIQPS
jgi:fibronectin type 3 domain-containing protein